MKIMNKVLFCILSLTFLCASIQGRAGEIFELSRKDAERKISSVIAEKEGGRKFKANFIGIAQDKMFLSGKPIGLNVDALSYDVASGKFEANLKFKNENETVGAKQVYGRLEEIVEVPVLKNRLSYNSMVTDADLIMLEVSDRSLRGDTIRSREELIGKALKSTVSPNRPIRLSEIQNPLLIKKGDMVKMIYRKGSVEISTEGVAQASASEGDFIKVLNTRSQQEVIGRVNKNGMVIFGDVASVKNEHARRDGDENVEYR